MSKLKQTDMLLWIGHTRPWEKIRVISKMSRNNVLLDGDFWPTRILSVEPAIFLDIFEMTSSFATGGLTHCRHPCQVWTISDTVWKLRHVRPFIGLFKKCPCSKFYSLFSKNVRVFTFWRILNDIVLFWSFCSLFKNASISIFWFYFLKVIFFVILNKFLCVA